MSGNQGTQAIFTEEWPVLNTTPMIFYLPPSSERADLTAFIEKYGGRVSDMHECFTHQIAPLQQEIKKNNFFRGDVYRAHWLVDSVKAGRLLDKAEYLSHTDTKSNKRLAFTHDKMNYTITEAIKIFEIGMANTGSASGSTFWQGVERKGVVPNRTADSMRNFWKVNKKSGLEAFLHKAVQEEYSYCHKFQKQPVSKRPTGSNNVEERVMQLALGNAIPVYQSYDAEMED